MGFQVFKWTQRFNKCLEMVGRTDGWAFHKNDDTTRALVAGYADDIYLKLEDIQETTNLIYEKCNVREDYGVQRSGRTSSISSV